MEMRDRPDDGRPVVASPRRRFSVGASRPRGGRPHVTCPKEDPLAPLPNSYRLLPKRRHKHMSGSTRMTGVRVRSSL
jgi:hypothetical protein